MTVMRLAGTALVAGTAPRPQPGRGELLIRVCAAGVTPTELLWYPTSHTRTGQARTGAVLGHEFSGVVAAIGEDAGGLVQVGQDVYGMNDWFSDGALAEYCVAPLSAVAPKPSRLSHIEAASVPIGALTAWQGLFERARLQPGERVLVHGAAGSVGMFAVQLARLHDAYVIATASARNLDFVRSLGAGQVIDYQASRFEEVVRDVDVVFDTVGGSTLDRSWRVLKPGGRMVTVAATEEAAEGRAKQAFFIVEPNHRQLTTIAELLQTGRLRTVVDAVVPLVQSADAYSGIVKRHGRGKLVVFISSGREQSGEQEAD